MAKYSDLSESINLLNTTIANMRKSEDWHDDDKVIKVLSLLHQTYWSQIWEYYNSMNNEEGEKGIRKCVRDIIVMILPICESKCKQKRNDLQVTGRYLELLDNFWALASCRSLEHFAQYLEFDKKPNQKLWKPTMHLFKGFWYYAGSMILNGDIKFISKQCFTGLGKTYSNAITLAFIFGNDINADALYVFGASENVGTFTTGLIDLMVTPRYCKIFPYFKQFLRDDAELTANAMFSIRQCKDTGSKFRIVGSTKPVNLRVVSKDKNTNGVRAKFLFLDDIAQLVDANNPKAHERDIFKLRNEWIKRYYDVRNFFIIAGGTTYSVDDILTYLLRVNNGEIAEKTKVNKFTKIANSDFIIHNSKAVFVCVPKLDYETDESTFPEKYPTLEARADRDNSTDNGRMFAAMEQQLPLSSIENPFDWGNIHIYESLPKTFEQGGTRDKRCRFIFDPSRKGNDATCCLFFSQDGDKHYFVDAFVDNQPLDHIYPSGKDVLDEVCEKIIAHRCIEGMVEENTASNIVTQITERLAKKGWKGTKVGGYYSYKVKKDKIYAQQTAIQSFLYFPSRRIFTANSEVGRAMRDITYWKYKDNIADDAPECCANYCEYYTQGAEAVGYASVKTFKR